MVVILIEREKGLIMIGFIPAPLSRTTLNWGIRRTYRGINAYFIRADTSPSILMDFLFRSMTMPFP